MIIIEGADNCGKTRLLQDLVEIDPKLHVIKRRRFKPDRDETIATSYINALIPRDGDRIAHGYGIMDRLLASECIYGDLLRGGSRITAGEHLAILNLLVSYQAVIVHCDIPDDRILQTWTEREQLYDNPLEVAHAYRDRIQTIFRGCSVIPYDWTSSDAGEIRRTILETNTRRLKAARRKLAWWSSVPFGIGQLERPPVILIGDSLSPSAKHEVPFSNGPAGSFLAWSLEQIGCDPARIFVTNANKGTDRDPAILTEELCFLATEDTRVILLGRQAESMYFRVIEDLDHVPKHVTAIPHPQWWSRFQYARRDEYPKLIESAIQLGIGT